MGDSMKINLIIELRLNDGPPIVQTYTSEESALEQSAGNYADDCLDQEVKGKALTEAVAAFRRDLESKGVYYCPHSESVYYLMERDLIKPAPVVAKVKPRWHVLTHMAGGAENCWTDTDGDNDPVPTTFATRKEAHAYLKDYLADYRQAVKDGDMTDAPKWADFTIERVNV
jgi:hypothetical protein